MNLVSIDGAAIAVKDGYLFEELSLGINEGDRIGLVGRNGAGKTSLLSLLAGRLVSDKGSISKKRGLKTNTLAQRPAFNPSDSIRAFFLKGDCPEIALFSAYETLLSSQNEKTTNHESFEREQARLHKEMDEADAFDLDRRFASLCSELGLEDLDRPMSSLSGGMVKKAAIARCLAPRSDLLLLDEPTNHLDVETIEWLEARLLSIGPAFVVVTHDRWFLNSVCSSMLEIDRRRVYSHPGNYSAWLQRKAERYASFEKAENRRLANLKIELEWLNRGARARATKSEGRKDRIREMVASGLVRENRMESFSSAGSRLGKKAVELFAASKSYGDKLVLKPFSYEISPGARVGIVGPNGAGKTTLLDLVLGRTEAAEGKIERGATVRFGYFDQNADRIDRNLSVIEFVREKAELVTLKDGLVLNAEQLLERFLFPREFNGLPVSRLSGGELRRLQLVRILAEAPNFLLLDEPTNDLDIETIELLEDFLESFGGCLLVVSHDRAFLDRVADCLIILDGSGGAKSYPGSYGDWRDFLATETDREQVRGVSERSRLQNSQTGRQGGDDENSKEAICAPSEMHKQKLTWAEKREFEGLLEQIDDLEEERRILEALFSRTGISPVELERSSRRYSELESLIHRLTTRWEELAERDAFARSPLGGGGP